MIVLTQAEFDRLMVSKREDEEMHSREYLRVNEELLRGVYAVPRVCWPNLLAAIRQLWLTRGGDPACEHAMLCWSEGGLFWLAPPEA